MTLDAVSASNMRHVVSRLAPMIRELIEAMPEEGCGEIFAENAKKAPKPISSDEMADKIAAAMQKARDQIGATEQQRIAFAYAEAAMRSVLAASPTGVGEDA